MAKQKSRFPSYGLVRGPSHEGGGVAGMVAGEQPVELEGGEWIIPKEAVPDYLPVLKQITNEGRAMQQMQNGNSAMDALIASASMEAGISEAKSPMFQDGGQINLRRQEMKLPYQDEAPYAGTDKIDDVIDIINSMSSNQVGGFGQTLNPVSYYGMPEAGRLSKKGQSQLSEAGYNKYAGDEERETSTKAAIMFDLLQRGQYNNDLDALRQDFLKSDVRSISPKQEQGGMIEEYQDGGKVGFLEKLPFIGPQLKGYREYQEADKYIDERHRGQTLFSDDVNNRGIQVEGETTRQVESKDDKALKNLFNTAMVNYDPEESSRGIARFNKSDSNESTLKKLLIGTPSGYRVSENDGRINYAVDPENIAEATSGKKLLGMFPVGYSGSVQPNIDTESQLDFSNLESLKALAGYEQGGPVNQYQNGGEVSWDDFTAPEEYNTHLVQSKVYDKMSQRNGKTNDYADSLIKSIALSEAGDPKQYTMDRMMEQSTSGNGAKQFGVIEDSEFKDFESGLQMGSELTATPRFKVEKEYAKEGDLEKRTGSSREQVSLGGLPGLSYLANLASKSGVSPESLVGKFFNAPLPLTLEKDIPTGKKSYKLGYSPQYQEQGGMINKYGHGGQMQPRKQQEIRNPQTYGPPLELMGPDTTGEGFQQMLNQMRMRDVNQSINPFTGDSLDIEGDSLKLLQRMQKSKMPRAGRKSMQNGGRVDEPDFSGLNTLSRFPNFKAPMSNPEFEAHMQYGERGVDSPNGQSPQSFMGSLERDNRVRPADRYEMVEDGVMIQKEVPKLSSAYMNSFGLETPLSRRQQSFLQRRAIAPETLNPQVKSLLGRALVQRLTNEPI